MADKTVFICSDGHRLAYNLWTPASGKEVKACVQILHGMAEYSDRYDKFAKFLTNKGFVVFAADHRGHGHTASKEELGWFAPADGWNVIERDAMELAQMIRSQYKDKKFVLFGHSMGSFLARTMIADYPDFYSAAIVMGSSASKGIVGKIGMTICKGQIRSKGQKSTGTLMDKLSFGSFNKPFAPARTSFDWLSRDEKEVDKYIKDPLCGFVCSNGFFLDMLQGIEKANSKKTAACISKTLPILLICGECDPVGNMGKDIVKIYNTYKSAGINDVEMNIVKDARHELLNETNKTETYKTILDWISAHI